MDLVRSVFFFFREVGFYEDAIAVVDPRDHRKPTICIFDKNKIRDLCVRRVPVFFGLSYEIACLTRKRNTSHSATPHRREDCQ
jgi:hypothetical protein